MKLSLLLPTGTTPIWRMLPTPLYSSGQETALSNCSLFRRMEQETGSPSTSTVTHSSRLPTSTMDVIITSTRSFTSGMAASSSCFSLSPLLELSPGIHLWCAVKRSWEWLITMMTVRDTTQSLLFTGTLDSGSFSTKRYQLRERGIWHHLNTMVTPIWQLLIKGIVLVNSTSTARCINGSKMDLE